MGIWCDCDEERAEIGEPSVELELSSEGALRGAQASEAVVVAMMHTIGCRNGLDYMCLHSDVGHD